MIRRLNLFTVIALLLGMPLSSAADEQQVVNIGAIVPLTGALGQAGTAFRDAMQLAVDESAGKGKFRYRLIIEDDGLQPAKVAAAAQKLINLEHVDAIISTWSYGGVIVAPLAERAKTVHFGVAWDPMVAKGKFNFIHLAPPKAFLPVFFEIFKRLGYRRIAAIGMIESGSHYCMDELVRLSHGTGLSVAERETVNYGEFDFRSLLQRAAGKKPDVFFTNLGTIENDLFMKQAKDLNIQTPITSITGFDVSENLALLEGRWFVSDSMVSDEFASRFQKRYGHKRLYGVGNFYDAVKLIIDRYEHSPGSAKPTSESLLPRFADLNDFSSVFGKLSIDEEGIISYPVQCRKIEHAERKTIPCDSIRPD